MVRALTGVLLDCRHPGELIRRGNIRHQAQENLRPHADADSPQTHKEEIDGGEVADAETKRNAGEIAVAEEKSDCESDGDAVSKRVCLSKKEKVVIQPDTGILTDRFEQEEETQEFSHAVSDARRIAFAINKPERDA